MTDVTQAAVQDDIANSLVSEETQETPEQTSVTEQETQQVESPQAEVTEQETAENWLPTEQDKVFPDEVYERYATERYRLTPEQAADPQIRQMLHDKINSDIYLAQQQELLQQQQQWEQQAEEQAQPETSQQQLPTREQYFQALERQIQERTDPEVAKSFHKEFMNIWQLPQDQQPLALTNTMSKYALNLVNTHMENLLETRLTPLLDRVFPGFGEMYERSSHAMAWDRVRNSDARFNSLPAYGTKEFSQTLRAAAAKIPGFDEMQFTDGQGRTLPAMENAMRKYAMLAQSASGGAVDPAMLQQAAAAGARNARRAAVNRAAGNLGSGQSKGGAASQSSKFQSNSDLFDEDTMARYKQEHGRL